MFACDFEYDGRRLNDFGFIICDFNHSSGTDNISAGSQIEFNTVARYNGKKYSLTSTTYGECITASFDICKDTDIYDDADFEITDGECRDMMRWLNRREFLPFQMFDDGDIDKERCYYNASFNIEKIVMSGTVVGLHLTMETDSPFGYGDKQERHEEEARDGHEKDLLIAPGVGVEPLPQLRVHPCVGEILFFLITHAASPPFGRASWISAMRR